MRLTRTYLTVTLSVIGLIGLAACSSKTEVFQIESSDERWFCTPKISSAEGEDEWLCQESDREFERLAKQKPSPVENISNQTDAAIEEKTKDIEQPVDWVATDAEQPVVENNLTEEPEGVTTEPSEPADTQEVQVQTQTQAQAQEQAQEDKSVEPETNLQNNPETTISPWVIQLAAYTQVSSATTLSQEVADSQTVNTRVKGRDYVSVVITGFDTRWQAQAKAEEVKSLHPQLSPWVRKGADFEQFITR